MISSLQQQAQMYDEVLLYERMAGTKKHFNKNGQPWWFLLHDKRWTSRLCSFSKRIKLFILS